jgi:hypothetical protein
MTFRNLDDVFKRNAGILFNFLQGIIVALLGFKIMRFAGECRCLQQCISPYGSGKRLSVLIMSEKVES